MHEVFRPRLQLITGKGGVGKSTVVAALALALARRGRRPLIVELGHRATVQSLFPGPSIGFEPVEVGEGVFAMNMELEGALVDYAARWVRFRRLAEMAVQNRELDRFLRAAPGVVETVTLAKLQALLEERHSGKVRWDPILVDLDATGHALMLLELPKVLDGLLGAGPLRRMLTGAVHLLADDSTTRLHLVSQPRELVVQETRELYQRITEEHAVKFGALFVNQVPSPPLSARARSFVESQEAGPAPAARGVQRLLQVARAAITRYDRARALTRELGRAVPTTAVELPRLPSDSSASDVVAELSEELGLGQTREGAPS